MTTAGQTLEGTAVNTTSNSHFHLYFYTHRYGKAQSKVKVPKLHSCPYNNIKMRLTNSRVYYRPSPPKMPAGLVELMEGLTREVLKNNPTDIYGFCAGHIQNLLEIRDGPQPKKVLSLQEKIAKAQEKVRQRAAKRRQQYDNELLQRSKSAETSDPQNETEILQPTISTGLKTQIIDDKELANSSEIEISHEPDNTDITIINDANTINDEVKTEKAEIETTNTVEIIPTENKLYNDLVTESTKETEDSGILTDLPTAESTDTKVELANELSTAIESENNTAEPVEDEQKTNADETATKLNDSVINEVDSNKNLTGSVDETVIVSSEINNEKESTQQEVEINGEDGDNIENISLRSSSQNSDVKEVTDPSNASTVEIEKLNLPLDEEKIQETNDAQNNSPLQQPLDVINTDHADSVIDKEQSAVEIIDNQSNPDMSTITVRFQESPALELQSPLLNSDLLESLSATDTDSDATTATLINQDSIKVELRNNASDDDLSNPAKSAETVEDFQVNDNIVTDLNNSNDESGHVNELEQNQDDNTDSVEKPIVESKNVSNDIDNNEDSTSTKPGENLQISNQDTNMDLETAAITIQKVFRTFMFKSRNSTFDDDATASDETHYLEEDDKTKVECEFPVTSSLNMDRRSHGLTRMDTVLQTVNEEKSLSLSTDDSSTLSSAATVIQAHVRGFLVRNKLNFNKTISTNSLAASNPSLPSLEMDNDPNKNKTVLNIHIVPEGGNYLSRDESLLTSMDLSLDSSPPSSINLHPLGNDKISERRKQLKREDAIQSISPPSNNSGKLSEDVDSVKELPLNDHTIEQPELVDSSKDGDAQRAEIVPGENSTTENMDTTPKSNEDDSGNIDSNVDQSEKDLNQKRATLSKHNSDEMDVVSPFISNEDKSDLKLMHSGEFHDAVLPTKVSRSDTSVASEFKNVLVYFLLWNNS